MASSIQFFSHFWSNVQGYTSAGLASKLRHIALICKKQMKQTKINILNVVSDTIVIQIQIQIQYRCDRMSTVQPLEVKVFCRVKHYYSNYVFSINSKLLVLEQRMQRGRVSLVEINLVIPNFAQKVNFKI